jgi:AcrR family transcriptional regulator
MAKTDTSVPRAKRKLDPEASRARILAAAAEAFAERGYAGARVEEISQRAGMSPRMLYHYFGSKEGLYAAVASENYRRLFARLVDVVRQSRGAPVLARLRTFMLAYLEAAHTDTLTNRFEQWESAGGWQILNHLRRDPEIPFREVANAFLGDIEEGIRTGIFRADLHPRFIVTISGTLATYYSAFLPRARQLFGPLPYGDTSTPRGREELVDFFLRGMVADPAALDALKTGSEQAPA